MCLWGLETFTVSEMSSDIIKVSLADLCGRCVTLLVRLQKGHLSLSVLTVIFQLDLG